MKCEEPQASLRLRYHRGTIVIEASEGGCDEGATRVLRDLEVPGSLWDGRIDAWRAPAFRHADIVRCLQATRIPFIDELPARRAGEASLRSPELRSYQEDAVLAWEMAGRRGLVVLPTGSGKTMVGIATIARSARAAIVMVPTRVLLEQWVAVLVRFCDQPVGVFGDGSRTVHEVTVITFESAFRHMDEIGDRFELLVVDEAHHFAGGMRVEALEMSAAPRRLGLTATPPARAEATERLATLIGPVVCHLSIADLSGRHLAPFDHIRLTVALTPSEEQIYAAERLLFEEAYRQFRRSSGSAEWPAFMRVAAASAAGRRALQGFHEARRIVSVAERKLELVTQLLARHAADRCLVFTASNTAAYALSRRLLIPAITCDIGREERQRVLDLLREGALRAIVSARVLNEGLDVPEARVGVIAGGTLGAREQVQRVGRLLRPRPGKRAVVYEVVVRETYEVDHAKRRQLCLAA